MRFIFFLIILISDVNAEDKLIQKKLPFDQSNLQSSYTLDDGTKIYIEQLGEEIEFGNIILKIKISKN